MEIGSCQLGRLEQQSFSFKEWWTKLGNAENYKKMLKRQELTAYIMWHIWKIINSWTFKYEILTESEVVQRVWEE